MKRYLKEFIKRVIVLLLVIAQLLPVYNIPAAHAADKKDSKIRFNDFYGEVKIRPDSEEDDSYEFVDLDTVIYEGDRIKTEEDSGAILGLEDMSTYVIKPESTLIIHTDEGNVSKIEMLAGSMWGNIKKMSEGKSLEIEMSQCVCGINGTTIYAQTSETRQNKLDPNKIKNDAEQIKNKVDKIQKDLENAKNGEKEQQVIVIGDRKKLTNVNNPQTDETKQTVADDFRKEFEEELKKAEKKANEPKIFTFDYNQLNPTNKRTWQVQEELRQAEIQTPQLQHFDSINLTEQEKQQVNQLPQLKTNDQIQSERPQLITLDQKQDEELQLNQLPQLKIRGFVEPEKLTDLEDQSAPELQQIIDQMKTKQQRDQMPQVQTFDQKNTEQKQQTEMEKVLASLPKTQRIELKYSPKELEALHNVFNKTNNNNNNNNENLSEEEKLRRQQEEEAKRTQEEKQEFSEKIKKQAEENIKKQEEDNKRIIETLRQKVEKQQQAQQNKRSVDALASTGNNSQSLLTGKNVALMSSAMKRTTVVKKKTVDTNLPRVPNIDDNNQQNNNNNVNNVNNDNNENNENLSEDELNKQKDEERKKQEEEERKKQEAFKKEEEALKKQEEELKKQEEEIAKRKDENLKNLTEKVNELKNNKKLTKKQQKQVEQKLKSEQDRILQQEKQEKQALQEKQDQIQQKRQDLQEKQQQSQQRNKIIADLASELDNSPIAGKRNKTVLHQDTTPLRGGKALTEEELKEQEERKLKNQEENLNNEEKELNKQDVKIKKEEEEIKKQEEEIAKRKEENLKKISEFIEEQKKNKNLTNKQLSELKAKFEKERDEILQQEKQAKQALQKKQNQVQQERQALQEKQDQVQQKRQTLQEKQANLRAQQNDQLDTGLASKENNSPIIETGKNVAFMQPVDKKMTVVKKKTVDTNLPRVPNIDDNNQQNNNNNVNNVNNDNNNNNNNNNNNDNNENLSEEELKKQEEENRNRQEKESKRLLEILKQKVEKQKQEEELKKQEEELKKQDEEITKRKEENLKKLTEKENELKNNKKLTKKQQRQIEEKIKVEREMILQQEKQARQVLQEKQDQIQQKRQTQQGKQQDAQQGKQASGDKNDELSIVINLVDNNDPKVDVEIKDNTEPKVEAELKDNSQLNIEVKSDNKAQIKDAIAPVNNNHQPNIADRVDSIAAKLNNEAQQNNNPAKTTAPGVAPRKPQASDAAGVVNNRATKVEDAANGVKNNAQKVQQMDGKVHDDRPKVKDAANGLNKLQDGKVRPQNMAQMSNRTDTVKVLKGTATITNKATKETFKVPAGNQATIAGNVVKVEPIINLEKDQNELNQQLDRSNDKQSTKQLIDKLNGQTGQINDSKKPVDNMLDTIKKLLDGNSPADKIKQVSSAYTKAVEEGKRFVSIFVEVNSTINVLSKRISADSVMVVSSDESEAAADAIKKAYEAMNSFSQSLETLVGYADKIEEKTGANPLDSLTSQAENANEIKETIVSSNGEIDEVTKGITDESSYSDFKNAITRCEALLRDLQNLNERLTVSEVGTEALAALKKQFLGVYLKVEKAIKDYSSVPEIKSATLKQMKDFDKDVPSFSSDIIKHLKEYKAINSSSTDAKKRYVESATRTLASYDRMRRVYTKANRMYTQMEKEFKQSKFKTAEYNDVKDSWEKIEQAMTTIDSEASELSSCVEDLKSQLESLLGK